MLIFPDFLGDVEKISQPVEDGVGVVEEFVGGEGGGRRKLFGEDLETLFEFGERDERGAEAVEQLESVVEERFVLIFIIIILVVVGGNSQVVDRSAEELDHETNPVIFGHDSLSRSFVVFVITVVSRRRCCCG